jgi:hypothetical protein
MWTTENRRRYDRDELRYPSDLTDDEWAQVEYLIPPLRSLLACMLGCLSPLCCS